MALWSLATILKERKIAELGLHIKDLEATKGTGTAGKENFGEYFHEKSRDERVHSRRKYIIKSSQIVNW